MPNTWSWNLDTYFSCGRTDQQRSKNGLNQFRRPEAICRVCRGGGNWVEPNATLPLVPIRVFASTSKHCLYVLPIVFEARLGLPWGSETRRRLRILAGEWHATPGCVHLMDIVVFAPMLLSPRLSV